MPEPRIELGAALQQHGALPVCYVATLEKETEGRYRENMQQERQGEYETEGRYWENMQQERQ